MTDTEITSFLNSKNCDIRVHHNARWIDQKCTPDVVCIVADCIVNYLDENGMNSIFATKDIWFSNYTMQNVHDIFRKVDVDSNSAKNEYDKFFGQPMKLFAYAGILEEKKQGRGNVYSIVNYDILKHIAIRERNALSFLIKYIRKVITDSGLMPAFDTFFARQTIQAYDDLKETFFNFTVMHTAIGSKGSSGRTECGRIFTKIINVLAFDLNKRGTEKGHLSKYAIKYDMLMYNRDNFRDIYSEKPKSVSRKDYMAENHIEINEAYCRYMSSKAKRRLKEYNDRCREGKSEIEGDTEYASHMHHIFPAGEFPEISYYLENLIALTPTQHLNYAHPNGRTTVIDRGYQHDCLLVKTDMIEENINNAEEVIYSFADFIHVLVVGFSEDSFGEIEESDYAGIKTKIELAYLS